MIINKSGSFSGRDIRFIELVSGKLKKTYQSDLRNVTEIRDHAFRNCDTLEYIEIPNCVEKISETAFEGCTNLLKITINNYKDVINSGARWGAPESVKVEYLLKRTLATPAISVVDNILTVTDTSLLASRFAISQDGVVLHTFDASGEQDTTIDLTTISLTDGVYEIAVTAQGEDYWDSDPSNLVEYSGIYSKGLSYSLNSQNQLCVSAGSTTDADVRIPPLYKGQEVQVIAERAFENFEGQTITIPPTIVAIEDYAFSGCGIKSVYIDDLVSWCNIECGNTHPANGGSLYVKNSSGEYEPATWVVIPEGVTSIGSAFYGCSNLRSVTLPSTVTNIDNNAFLGCSNLVEVINKSSLDIQKGASSNGWIAYYAMEVHDGPSKLVAEGDYYFYTLDDDENYMICYQGSDTELTLPENYKEGNYGIFNKVFANRFDITSVIIPDSVTSIGNSAFENCKNITSIIIPNSVTSIGSSAFAGCSRLTSLYIEDIASWYTISFNNPSAHPSYYNGAKFYAKTDSGEYELVENLVIPNTVTHISAYAFYKCTSIKSISLSDSVTTVGQDAFWGCNGVTQLEIPANVTSIESGAFAMGGLETINVNADNSVYYSIDNCIINLANKRLVVGCKNSITPTDGSVTSIGGGAFGNSTQLTNITIPSSITSIEERAFSGSGITNLIVPDTVERIGIGAFEGYKGSSITLPFIGERKDGTGITRFGYIFGLSTDKSYMSHNVPRILTTVVITGGTEVDQSAFDGCRYIKTVIIPDSVTRIRSSAFRYCESLTSITIGSGVTSIGFDAFEYCDSPKTVYYNGDMTSWFNISFVEGYNTNPLYIDGSSLYIRTNSGEYELVTEYTIPDTITTLKSGVFSIPNITSITIPDSVTTIDYYAFAGCRSLTHVTMGSGVTSIGISAFSRCSSLTNITIPNSVTSIGESAFNGCSSLTSAVFETSTGWRVHRTSNWYEVYGLEDSTTAAQYLVDDYVKYEWRRW